MKKKDVEGLVILDITDCYDETESVIFIDEDTDSVSANNPKRQQDIIEETKSEKLLGVFVNNKLTW